MLIQDETWTVEHELAKAIPGWSLPKGHAFSMLFIQGNHARSASNSEANYREHLKRSCFFYQKAIEMAHLCELVW